MMGGSHGFPEISAQAAYDGFWPKATEEIRTMDMSALKHQELPLARIKKIMKLDDDVKMISAEAPVLFSKAAEMFITELTMRAWIHTEDNKRRTLQRNDIAMAITKYDQFDFLIDIVPRDDIKPATQPPKKEEAMGRIVGSNNDQVSYYLQMAQQQQLQGATATAQTQVVPGNALVQPQIIQLQPTQMVNQITPPAGGIQIVQQIVGPNGEIQQIPIQLTAQQLGLIRQQMTGAQQQPLVIQTAPIQAASLQGSVPQTVQVTQGQQASMQTLGHQVYITDQQQ
ncbi:hypothetical protein TCAL_02643 [Tigriopus californicus]|uniref:Nuclear transcription factor Y subunit gamma n=1 Tax=Tigriopus californicus TaxID=6832 RepID=A0A553ND85_TIGCA|nr:nuclear transcription factor Y subunit gamma-like [Tigriopus californicus]TRY63411.1 hypothetical protein TCAL_02643 [Tigriopus californicus]|eukprot:TCALIF_02643-PA protein Name:"Similar to Nfyc Nuclear transcription factor Y subunit gamma (Mus musculus)" AED:0.04 eAED:0.04 QI:192/0.66/0.5/1/1/0.75/4/0/282